MTVIFLRWKSISTIIVCLLLLVFYNECLHYYVVLMGCRWPTGEFEAIGHVPEDALHAMVLSDTHLLGYRDGHWFDKLRREWQMERSFRTAIMLHNPDVVFILGDLLDEGKWCDDQEFDYHVTRFKKMFHSENTELIVVAGNHDIGFHYMADKHKRQRFAKAFNTSSVQMLSIKNNIFVFLNSMAFEGDGCAWCREAEKSLKQVVQKLNCAQKKLPSCPPDSMAYSRPVVVQHFPLFRQSDAHCSGPDAADPKERTVPLQPGWGCLSKEISEQVLNKLRPRLVLSGHTHHFCLTLHKNNIPEWTVPSFSWRNRNNPSFLLLMINNSTFEINKCYLPKENTVIAIYVVGIVGILVLCILQRRRTAYHRRTD